MEGMGDAGRCVCRHLAGSVADLLGVLMEHLVFWLGAVADWYTTRRGLKKAGIKEANGLMAKAMKRLGRDWAITLIKGAVWLGFYLYGMPAGVFYMAGGMQFAAAGWNLYIIRRNK